MKWMARSVLFGLGFLLLISNASAGDIYPLETTIQQQQFYRLTHQLRCLVCQNEDIASSGAKLAADMRAQVYRMILQQKTDEQIKHYMVKRYGNFVLFKPAVNQGTYLLWFGPFALVILGLLTLWLVMYKQRRSSLCDPPINEHDNEQVTDIISRVE